MKKTAKSPKSSVQAAGSPPHSAVSSRQRFLDACHCRPVDRPPVWLMRQAGRCLPEYRALKEKHSFVELVQNPELAAEVTLQPIRRFGFDAAILFSDILVVPEAMGQKYRFREQGGVEMEFRVESAKDIERLQPNAIEARLHYAVEALRLIKKELGGKTALIGFAGAPWTLANYMLEGGSADEFTKAKALFYSDPRLYRRLLEKLSEAVATYLQMQIDAGVDAIQIFDSNAGCLSAMSFESASAQWIQRIIQKLGNKVPVILFARGANGCWDTLVKTGANILSVDWTMDLHEIWSLLPENVGVQGNLDPALLNTTSDIVTGETTRLLNAMRNCAGHIFNLGHGVPATTKLENIEALVDTIGNFK